jgi:hypothetical protein
MRTKRPNLSLNPDASPAALTRRPLGADYLVRWALFTATEAQS